MWLDDSGLVVGWPLSRLYSTPTHTTSITNYAKLTVISVW